MAIKEKIDFSTFTDRRSSKDLYANSVRKGLKYDAFGDQTKFQAIVISDPIPFSPEDLKYFTGDTGNLKEIWNNINNTTTQFSYRARIIGNNSPHSFLPDPCDSTYAADSAEALKIVAMHTLFVSNEEGGAANSVPRLGSKVEVELTKNIFGYNLQFGKHSKLVANPEPSTASAEACDTLKSIMDSAVEGSSPFGGISSAEDNKVFNDISLLNPKFRDLINKLISNMKKRGYTPFVYETWRSKARQVYVFEQGASKTIDAGTHGQGMAVDFIDGRPHPDRKGLKVGWGSYEKSYRKKGQKVTEGDKQATIMAKDFFDALGEEATALGLEWGGSWRNFVDKPHVQAPSSMRRGAPKYDTVAELKGTPKEMDPSTDSDFEGSA